MNPLSIKSAVGVLRQGGIVAFPTESSYGLSVDIHNESALHRLYQLKQRSAEKPLLILVDSVDAILAEGIIFPQPYQQLAKKFWAGALTLIFPASSTISAVLTAGTGTVGIRISSHPLAGALVKSFGSPITATSANVSGFPPCQTAAEVFETFGNSIDYILDGGKADGIPSTIVGLQDGQLQQIRAGQIRWHQIEQALIEK